MSLDTIELVMDVEETFDITIRDEDAEKIRTVGDLYRYVLGRVDLGTPILCPSQVLFYRIRRALIESIGVSRERVRPATPIDDLVPRDGRRTHWRRLGSALGMRLPRLRRPKPLGEWVASAWWATTLLALAILAVSFRAVTVEAAFVGVFMTVAVTQVAALCATRPFATELAPGCTTVHGLVGSLIDMRRERTLPVGRQWDEVTVWSMLTTVVSEFSGVERDKLTEETSIVYDLGLD